MPGPASFPASSPAIRIRKGETIIALAWSNTATQLFGRFRVLYDDGSEDDFIFPQTLLTNNRLTVLLQSGMTAIHSGWILSGQIQQQPGVANQSAQRGQCYVRACVVSAAGVVPGNVAPTASVPECRATICSGYVYSGVDVCVGQLIEPGPAGGHGQQTNVVLAAPAAGADYTTVTIPTGAMYRVYGFHGQLVAAVAAANREFTIKLVTGAPLDLGGCVASEIQTSGQTQDYYGAPGVTTTSASAGIGPGAIQIGLPVSVLSPLVEKIAFQTYNIQGADQWGAGQLAIEEWVMPN